MFKKVAYFILVLFACHQLRTEPLGLATASIFAAKVAAAGKVAAEAKVAGSVAAAAIKSVPVVAQVSKLSALKTFLFGAKTLAAQSVTVATECAATVGSQVLLPTAVATTAATTALIATPAIATQVKPALTTDTQVIPSTATKLATIAEEKRKKRKNKMKITRIQFSVP